jgi:hypothetical protein
MYTLADIDAIRGDYSGSIYSNLYKDVYGVRPRGSEAQFSSMEEFDRALEEIDSHGSSEPDVDEAQE